MDGESEKKRSPDNSKLFGSDQLKDGAAIN